MSIKEGGQALETLVADILRANDLQILESSPRDRGYDLRVKSSEREALVEVKTYSTLKIAHSVVRQSFYRLRDAMRRHNVSVGIFATNARLPRALWDEAKLLHLVIYDFDTLQFLTAQHPALAERLARHFQDVFLYRSEPLPSTDTTKVAEFIPASPCPPTPPPPGGEALPPDPKPNRGDELGIALKATKAGRSKNSAAVFERTCVDALRYLFEEDFIGWNTQTRSHNSLHRYDLIVRINSQNDFWNLMITDHRSRYVILEFKNYPKKISQVQIYSTEKYLLPAAMRATAIIISRLGFDANAFRVSAAALRQEGKLILGLDLEEVCEMLHAKDNGDDPSVVVARKLDELLIGLER
ncbi:MAG TPA: restriction endonuclease [Xanthobacteraceae bacterium]|nr:restriction endonuclease [Xanthobacteraceae bacterium]